MSNNITVDPWLNRKSKSLKGDIDSPHALAFRIYESQGEEEYSEGEVDIIRRVAENFCLPGVIDGLYEQLDKASRRS